jgi:hypothetical protein
LADYMGLIKIRWSGLRSTFHVTEIHLPTYLHKLAQDIIQ